MIELFVLLLTLVIVGIVAYLVLRYLQEERLLSSLHLILLEVTVPKDLPQQEKDREGTVQEQVMRGAQFLASLAGLREENFLKNFIFGKPTWGFEVVAHPDGEIIFFVSVPRRYEEFMEKQILAFYPRADVRRVSDYTIFEEGDTVEGGIVKQHHKKYLPLKTFEDLPSDPMQGITQALSKMEKGDGGAVQFIVRPASASTRAKGRSVTRQVALGKEKSVRHGSSAFSEATKGIAKTASYSINKNNQQSPRQEEREEKWQAQMSPAEQERLERVDKKTGEYQFEVTMRLVVSCKTKEAAESHFLVLKESLTQFGDPSLNELSTHRQTKHSFFRDYIFRTFKHSDAMVLSLTELLSLFHFPLSSTETPNIRWRTSRSVAAPANLPRNGVLLGYNDYRGTKTPIHLQQEDRRRHMYMIGQTGTGKTTLFKNMIMQDIRNGSGVGVVDPHGQLIEDILLQIPRERAEDVIIFDPRDTERPLGLNMLEARDPAQRDLVVSELIMIIEKLATRMNPESIGPMFEHYLRNALLTLVEDPESTMIDISRLFTDKAFRDWLVPKVKNPIVREFWEKEYAQSLKGQQSADMLSYVISKLGRFIGNEVMRNIIGQPKSSFDLREIMDNKKILLVNLSKGSLGDINADLLGFILVSKLQITALSRTDIPENQRKDFYLYLDEFQNFTTDTVGTILSEARKYRLDLNLTHQFIAQLSDEIREAVFGNVGTVISYRVGVEDSEMMAKQLAPVFDEYDLINVPNYNCFVRLLAKNQPQRPFSMKAAPPPPGGDEELRRNLYELSRLKFGRPKAEVEERILERLKVAAVPGSSGMGPR